MLMAAVNWGCNIADFCTQVCILLIEQLGPERKQLKASLERVLGRS